MRMCHYINVGRRLDIYGKVIASNDRTYVYADTIRLLDRPWVNSEFVVEKAKIWDYLSKVPGVSRLIPEAMKL